MAHFCCSELKIGRHKEKLLFIKRTCSQLAPQSVSGILALHLCHLSLQSYSSKYRLSNSGSSASYSFKSLTTLFKLLSSHFTNSGGTSLNRPLILSLEFSVLFNCITTTSQNGTTMAILSFSFVLFTG